MYKLLFEKRFFKDLDKLPAEIVKKIHEVIKRLSENPRPQGIKKLITKPQIYRLRIGNYRLCYTIDDEQKEIKILFVRHRKEAYRNI